VQTNSVAKYILTEIKRKKAQLFLLFGGSSCFGFIVFRGSRVEWLLQPQQIFMMATDVAPC
jgi:hypothetical protein